MIEAGYERGNVCRSFRGKRCSVWLVVTFVVLASMYQQHLIKSIDHIYTAESASPKGLFLSFTVLLGWAALFTAAFSVNFMIPPDPLGLCLSRFAGCSGSSGIRSRCAASGHPLGQVVQGWTYQFLAPEQDQ